MAETATASVPDVDAFLSGFGVSLAHFGVKGMKWGVRKKPGLISDLKVLSGNQKELVKRRSVDPSSNRKSTKEQKAEEKRYQRKVSAAVNSSARSDAKETAKKVALVAVKYGAPSAAVAAGAAVGLPAVAAFGISVKALQEPAVQDAIAVGARYTKSLVSDMGDISVPKMNLPNPNFGTKSVSRDISREISESKKPMANVQVGEHTVKVPIDQTKFFLKQSNDMHDLED